MPTSQNGWPVAGRDDQDRAPLIRDVTVPNGVLAGDVATVFRWLAREYDKRVERLDAGECWGWFVRKIEGSDSYSNHASGTAVDFNAPDNPMGSGTTKKSLTEEQIATCHAIEAESGGVLRWGGDFGRNDPMHWEINANRSAVAAFARKIREGTMAKLDDEDREWLRAEIRKVLTSDADPTDRVYSLGGLAAITERRTSEIRDIVQALRDEVKALRDEVRGDG